MVAVDYAKLREQTMGSGLDEEAVTVNTRALIDKVLARYSGEWTTLRELIQNAADASATKVVIRFETLPSSTVLAPQSDNPSAQLKHVLSHHTLGRLLVSNNGEAFAESDWSRLKRIAEGNPDEQKIGAFGVGFYSVFADCETPFVSSGEHTMAFYWKGNSLFTRRGRLPEGTKSTETAFMLDYRSTTSPVPPLLSLCQFLSTSLTFVGLETIELWLDQYNLLTLTKKSAPAANVSVPPDLNPKTKEGLMKIVGVEHQSAQIDAKWMNVVGWSRTSSTSLPGSSQASEAGPPVQSLRSFFSRFAAGGTSNNTTAKRAAKEEEAVQKAISEDLVGHSTATVFLRISTVNIQTYVSKQLAAELERATKKPPPKHTRIAILTSSYDETSASISTVSGLGSAKAAEIFAAVLPTKNGRIFIGFPTAQTTGLLAHISAPSVIPTVERESIDLNARYVRTWNVEMLRVAGIACRMAYTGEMAELKGRLSRQLQSSGHKKVQKEDLDAIIPAAVHVLKQYTYQESTPSSQVGQIIEEAFWTCSQKQSIDILSTRGILPSIDVRLASEDLSFVEGIPVIPDQIVEKASDFLTRLQGFGLLSEITTQDIKKELEAQALTESQLSELLRWSGSKMERDQLDSSAVHALFDGTVATISDEHVATYAGPVLLLGAIDTFPTIGKIPAEMPMPPNTIPFRVIKGLSRTQLEAFGWTELQIVPWLRYLIEKDGQGLSVDQSLTKSVSFAGQILPVLSKAWDPLSQSSKATVVELLAARTVIPTKMGMRRPAQAYFASVRLFDDLPTITGLQGVKEKFLSAMGVRKTVELSVVFERLMAKSDSGKDAAETKWSHVDLIKYLVSVRDDIPKDDILKLRKTPICAAESTGTADSKTGQLYRPNELFEPKAALRELGLPIIQWPDHYRFSSPEAKFLALLGLRPYPSVTELVDIMAKAARNGDTRLYETALGYLIQNHYPNSYRTFPFESIETGFLPVQGQTLKKLATPKQCFVNEGCQMLGFELLREDLRPHAPILGVSLDPPIAVCADRLVKQPPLTKADAKTVFGYFGGRLNEIGAMGNLAERLGEASIVPTLKSQTSASRQTVDKNSRVRLLAPRSCFLGDSQTFGEIFDFVDFGADANAFLMKVGSKNEPSNTELADMICREPARLLNTLGSDKYLTLLRRIADNSSSLKTDKAVWANLKRAKCLIACREVTSTANAREDLGDDTDLDPFDDEEYSVKEYSLASAPDMVLADDYHSYRLFKDRLLTGPQEETLEKFYSELGTPWLSSLVENDQRMGSMLKDQTVAAELQSRIVERCRLFLHDVPSESVRHDFRWLEKNLAVQAVASLSLRRTLRGGINATNTEKRSAALHRETKKDATLYITPKYDLYEVSRALMSLLLKRPKQQDFLALEMILQSDLRRLKTKGYNVDRILRQKAAESRIAENERQKQMEEEQKRIAEQEQAYKAQAASQGIGTVSTSKESPDRPRGMPGAFNDPPEPSNNAALPTRPKTGLFSGIRKQLGFPDEPEAAGQQAQRMLEGLGGGPRPSSSPADQPPPYTAKPSRVQDTSDGPEHVTPPHDLRQNLVSAVQASRAWDSSTLFSPPSTKAIKENATYCDSKPGHDLTFVADSKPGIKIYLDRRLTAEERTSFLRSSSEALNAFAFLLLDCGSVFALKPQSLHIFYNEQGSSIAFNSNGSIFCNLRFFLQLHWSNWSDPSGAGKKDAAVYWFATMCHELAHNLISDHGSEHGFYTESFFSQYFFRMAAKAAQYEPEMGVGLLQSSPVTGTIPSFTSNAQARRPANIPLHTLSSSSRRSAHHRDSDSFDEKRSGLHRRRRSSASSLDSPGSDFSLWSDTGDLVDQLADEEDPLRARLRTSAEAEHESRPPRGRKQKSVRYNLAADQEKERQPTAAVPKRKEDIRIPSPPPRRVTRSEKFIAFVMAPTDRMSRMHGLHGKKLIYFTSVFVSLGVFLFGYDQGVMSGIITGPYFKDYFNQPTRAELGTMVAILEVGAFISSLLVGRMGDILGRRRTIFYGALIFLVGGALQTFATGMPMMLMGRIIAGLGVGALSTIVPIYQSEISPPHNRGKLACIEFTGNVAGYAASVWVDYACTYIHSDWSWRVPLLMQCVMGALLGVGSLVICESPRWLLDNDHDEEGIVVIANFYGKGDIHNQKARDEYREIKMNVLLQRQEGERSYRDMFKRYYKRVFIACSAQALAQLNGINVISYYAPLVFEQAGWVGRDAILMTGINALTYLASTVPPWYLVDRLGRRFILLWGAVAMIISLSAISYFIYIDLVDWTPRLVVIFVMIYNAAFGASWGPIPWLYPPEILPLSIRAKGASLSTASNWAFNWLVGEMTPVLQELIKWRLYLLHAFFCAVSFVVVWFIYPETANVRLEDMNSIFGDATTAAPTPQTLAEAESLFGDRSPVPSFSLGENGADSEIPDLEPPEVEVQDGKPMLSKDKDQGEGLGGWISGLVSRGKDDAASAGGSGRYKQVGQDEEQ